jgi:hypothetical protein
LSSPTVSEDLLTLSSKNDRFWDAFRIPLKNHCLRCKVCSKIAVALHDELGRVPKEKEIEQVFLMARVMYKAILGLHYKRQEQKKNGQLAIF